MDAAFAHLAAMAAQGTAAVLATVVRGRGSTYRKPGASAVIAASGEAVGTISGGCLDQDVVEVAAGVCAGGPARLLSYDTGDDEDLIWGTASGCGGLIEVLVAPVAPDVLRLVSDRLQAGAAAAVATVIRGAALGRRLAVGDRGEPAGSLGAGEANAAALDAARRLLEGGARSPEWLELADGTELFLQPVLPLPRLLIAGAGDDARPVAELARQVGFRVAVADRRAAWVTPRRFPRADRLYIGDADDLPGDLVLDRDTYAVVMTHHLMQDLAWLQRLLDSDVPYVGLLGARERSRKLVGMVLADRPDLEPACRERLRAPVGLDLGADGPEQIAVSIIAEVLAFRQHRPGLPLSQRVAEGATSSG